MKNKQQKQEISLLQKQSFAGSREYIINGCSQLILREKSFFRFKGSIIPLKNLEKDPTFYRQLSKRWLFSTCLSVLGLSISFWLLKMDILSVIIGIVMLICIFQLAKKSCDHVIFHNIDRTKKDVVFWNNKPNQDNFREFIDELSLRIGGISSYKNEKIGEQINHHILQLNALYKAEIINKQELSVFSEKAYQKVFQ